MGNSPKMFKLVTYIHFSRSSNVSYIYITSEEKMLLLGLWFGFNQNSNLGRNKIECIATLLNEESLGILYKNMYHEDFVLNTFINVLEKSSRSSLQAQVTSKASWK